MCTCLILFYFFRLEQTKSVWRLLTGDGVIFATFGSEVGLELIFLHHSWAFLNFCLYILPSAKDVQWCSCSAVFVEVELAFNSILVMSSTCIIQFAPDVLQQTKWSPWKRALSRELSPWKSCKRTHGFSAARTNIVIVLPCLVSTGAAIG